MVCGWEIRNACRCFTRYPEGKRPLGRPKRGWENNIKMVVTGTGWQDMDWLHFAQDRNELTAQK
jgi:hypothetical protein